MSRYTISIIFIITILVANAVYIINKDIDYSKEKKKQRERILDFEMTSKFKIKKSTKKDIKYIDEYYLKERYLG